MCLLYKLSMTCCFECPQRRNTDFNSTFFAEFSSVSKMGISLRSTFYLLHITQQKTISTALILRASITHLHGTKCSIIFKGSFHPKRWLHTRHFTLYCLDENQCFSACFEFSAPK